MSEPGPLVLEMRAERGGEVYARRVTEAGEVWVYTEGGLDDDGWEIEGRWELLATLPAAALHQLEQEAEQLFSAPAENAPAQTVLGGGTETWTVDLGGRRHAVRVQGAPINEVEPVAQVARALEEALAAAE
jgi:hypothetical protein